MRKLAHIINPVIVDRSSDLFAAQPITFETMRLAKEFARPHVEVRLLSAQYEEDRSLVPDYFELTPDLQRSVLDVAQFRESRRLPLLVDILDRLYRESEADYFVYANVDIAVMPHFYLTIARLTERGHDAFVINRRTISERYMSLDEIPLMYSEIGEAHPGYDCFVFPRTMYPKLKLGTICVGVNWVGTALLWNLMCYAENFAEFEDLHLTFHIGNRKEWKKDKYSDYSEYNRAQASEILADLESKCGPFGEDGLVLPHSSALRARDDGRRGLGSKVRSLVEQVLPTPSQDEVDNG